MGLFPTDAVNGQRVTNAKGTVFEYDDVDNKWFIVFTTNVYTQDEVDALIAALVDAAGAVAAVAAADDYLKNDANDTTTGDLTVANLITAGLVDTVDVSALKTAFDALSYYTIAEIDAMDIHPQAHTLASHTTKAHAELTDVTANQHHTPPVASDFDHDDIALPNGNANEQHLTAAEVAQLHDDAITTNAHADARIAAANHDVLQNPNGNAEEQHLTAAQVTALRDANKIQGKTIDVAALADNKILKYDLASTSWKCEDDLSGGAGWTLHVVNSASSPHISAATWSTTGSWTEYDLSNIDGSMSGKNGICCIAGRFRATAVTSDLSVRDSAQTQTWQHIKALPWVANQTGPCQFNVSFTDGKIDYFRHANVDFISLVLMWWVET